MSEQQPSRFSKRTLAVIDGNSLMHRAFHAVPSYMTAPDGRPTNACFGFLSMLLKLAEDFTPDGIIAAFDHGIPAFRLKAIEQYKAHRPPTDPELKQQFPMIKEILGALSIPVVELEGWEGDDILGTLASRAATEGIHALLVTGDKDALQLVTDEVQVINTRQGMSDVIVYDPPGVFEKWGVTPEQVPDFLGLMGDSSDNIPGVPGVGPKKASVLLQEYGSLEGVLAHGADIKGKLGESIRENVDKARASREVATIRCDVPLECDLASVRFPTYDPETVSATFRTFALTSQLKKVLSLVGAQVPTTGAPGAMGATQMTGAPGAPGATQVMGVGAGALGVSETTQTTIPPVPLASSGETYLSLSRSLPAACAVFIAENRDSTLFSASRILCVASPEGLAQFDDEDIATELARLVASDVVLVGHDLKASLAELLPAHNDRPALIDFAHLDPTRLFDCHLAAYLLDSARGYHQPEDLIEAFLPQEPPAPDDEEASARCARIAQTLLALYPLLHARLEADGSLECFRRIEMPLVPVLLLMERWGVRVDPQALGTLNTELTATIEDLRSKALYQAGEDFNLDSPKQLGHILFEKLQLPTAKKTRSGYSTDAKVLSGLKDMHPLPGIMLEYRELAKLKSTYLDALPRLIASDGHIHTSFNQTVAATGRLSSSDPNLQNIPVRTDLGRQIRAAFIPDAKSLECEQAIFLSADYSQIELRLLAHLSGDEGLIEAFREGEDFHAETAARVFGLPLSEITPQLRGRAKSVNFGIVYGQQAFGLAQSLGVGMDEARDMIKRYFVTFPRVRDYLDEVVEQAKATGWAITLFGRKRHIREMHSSNANLRAFGERTAMNHPMQGSAADIIKLAMVEVQRRLDAEGFISQMILQIHDELDFNCAADEVERLSVMVREAMEQVVELKVPLTVDVTTGPNWALAH